MLDIEEVKNRIDGIEKLEKLSEEALGTLRGFGLPEDYLLFLAEIGYGNLGELQLYSSPVKPDDIYPNIKPNDGDAIVLFGDDFQGYCFGFDKSDGMRVVEIDPKGNIDRTVNPDFGSLMESYFDLP